MRDLRVGGEYAFIRHPPRGQRITPQDCTAQRVRVVALNETLAGYTMRFVRYKRLQRDGSDYGLGEQLAGARSFVMYWPRWAAERNLVRARRNAVAERTRAEGGIAFEDLDEL